jgi:hypothetical protein
LQFCARLLAPWAQIFQRIQVCQSRAPQALAAHAPCFLDQILHTIIYELRSAGFNYGRLVAIDTDRRRPAQQAPRGINLGDRRIEPKLVFKSGGRR